MMYENISILRGDLTNEEIENEMENFKNYFKENNIEIEKSENLGLKKLAYNVRGNSTGIYFDFEISGDDINIYDFERFLRINDNVIKFITLKLENEIEKKHKTEESLEQ